MELLPTNQFIALLDQGEATRAVQDKDMNEPNHKPVVKLFTPDANATWLLSELDPEDTDLAFGLCDLGVGEPELGYVRISELEKVKGRSGLAVERDIHFTADKTLSEYAKIARKERRIIT